MALGQSGTQSSNADLLDGLDSTEFVQVSGDLSEGQFLVINAQGQAVGTDTVTGTIIIRAGTETEIDALVLAEGELAYVTDAPALRVGDGSTAGGKVVWAE